MHSGHALSAPRRWLVLPIESNVRELEARTLLAAVAAERGFGAIIGRQSELPRYLPALPPSVVLQMNAFSTGVFDLARRHSHVITALDEEGLVVRDRHDYLRRRISVAALEQCDRFFAWGNAHRSAIASKAPHLGDRIVATGSPRIDLLRPEFRAVYQADANALVGRLGRFVLFDSNFGTYNHRLGPDHVAKMWTAAGWAKNPNSKNVLSRTIRFQEGLFDEFASAIEALAVKLPPDVGIVLRPHPAERHDTWHERLHHVRSTHVLHEGGVIPWLLAAEAVIHNSCTTGLEAAILGRPTFAYLAMRDELIESPLANDVSRQVEDKDELIAGILGAVEGDSDGSSEDIIPLLQQDVSHLEGSLASEAILDEIEAIAPPPQPLDRLRALNALVRIGREVLRARSLASSLRRRDVRGERRLAAFVRDASPGISLSEIDGFLTGIARASDRFNEVVPARLGPDLIVVTSRGSTGRPFSSAHTAAKIASDE